MKIELTDPEIKGNGSFDLVAVHGLLHSDNDAWNGSSTITWLTEKLEDYKLAGRVLLYSHRVGVASPEGRYTRQAIKHEALQLLSEISQCRKDQDPPRPIAFVAEDVGGLIVKEALIQASRKGHEFASIKAHTLLLAFIGCPHRWQNIEQLENAFCHLLLKTPGEFELRNARCLSSTTASINSTFLQTHVLAQATVINMYSSHHNAIGIDRQSIATLGIPMEIRCGVKTQNIDLADHASRGVFIKNLKMGLDRMTISPWRNEGYNSLFDSMVSQAAPILPMKTVFGSNYPYSRLEGSPIFQDWSDPFSFQRCKILHIYGSAGVSQAAEYSFLKIRGVLDVLYPDVDDAIVLYFQFSRYDERRNSLEALATTLLAQTRGGQQVSQSLPLHPSGIELPLFRFYLAEQDVLYLFNNLRLDLGSRAKMTWIIDRLDECEPASRQQFLSQLAGLANHSEGDLRVLITSTNPQSIHQAVPHARFSELNLDSLDPGDGSLRYEVLADEVYRTIGVNHPPLATYGFNLSVFLQTCGPDQDFINLMRDWLRTVKCKTRGAMDEELQRLSPPSPTALIARILGDIGTSARPLCRQALFWMLYARRPLTTDELTSALATNFQDIDVADLLPILCDAFGPLIVVESDEVRFSQPLVRDFFASSEAGQIWYTIPAKEQCHRELARTCVQFLSLLETLKHISAACCSARYSAVMLDDKQDLCAYAIRHWAHHYRQGRRFDDENSCLQEEISEYVNNTKALRLWFAAKWNISPRYLRAPYSPLHPLLIFASLGLKEQVDQAISQIGPLTGQDMLIVLAIREATRNGHEDIVQGLVALQCTPPTELIVNAMEVAAYSTQFNILRILFSYLRNVQAGARYQWPHLLLCRVAWAGEEHLLKALLEHGRNSIDYSTSEMPTILYCAAVGGHSGTIGVILDRGAAIDGINGVRGGNTALHAAVRSGRDGAIRTLAKRGVDLACADAFGATALERATMLGQHQALRALLDAGAQATASQKTLQYLKPWSAFTYAAAMHFPECLRLLLDHTLDVDHEDPANLCVSALARAASAGDVDICRLLLGYGANANISEHSRPLTRALDSNRDNMELLKLLVDRGADVNLEDTHGTTVLEVASKKGIQDAVKYLLEQGANANGGPKAIFTPLYKATEAGHVEIVRLLLAAGADFRACSDWAWTPVHRAWNEPECLALLLDAGAEVDAPSRDSTALYIAAYNGNVKSVKALISHGANIETKHAFSGLFDSNFTPLLAAIYCEHTEIIRELLKAGADTKARSPADDASVLHLAASDESGTVLRLLLEYNVELDAQDKLKHTPLHEVLLYCKTDPMAKIEALVNRGANVNLRGAHGYLPLDLAVKFEHLDTARYLVTAGSNLNAVGALWGGPLHTACQYFNVDVARYLVAKGADVNLVDPLNGTPLQLVLRKKVSGHKTKQRENMVQYLINEAGADITVGGGFLRSALHLACLNEGPDLVDVLIEKGADVHLGDLLDRQPIHCATFQTLTHVEKILSLGADVQVKDKLGRTLLHTAVASGRVDTVQKCLFLTKVSVDEPDRDGWTPLLWAVRACTQWGSNLAGGQVGVVQFLLAEGANLWATGRHFDDSEAWSALKLARYYGASKEVVSLLKREMSVKRNDRPETVPAWDPQAHRSRRGHQHHGYCDACLYTLYGRCYHSSKWELGVWCCRKCYMRRDELFPGHEAWRLLQDEFDAADEDGKEDSDEEEGGKDEEKEKQQGSGTGDATGQTEVGTPGASKQVQEAEEWSDSD